MRRGIRTATLAVASFALLVPALSDVAAATSTDAPRFITAFGQANPASKNGKFSNPNAVATDSKGNVYVADSSNNRIQKFSSTGKYLLQWGKSDPRGNTDSLRMMSMASNDEILFNYPSGIAVDSDDNVYVADTNNNRIQKFTDQGAYISQWGTDGTGDGEFQNPTAIAVGNDNDIYVADRYNNRIQKFTKDGDYLSQIGSYGSGDGEFANPLGVVVDSDGNVYVADGGNYRIQKFSDDGTYLSQWGMYGQGNGEFDGPTSLSIDSDDNIYVTDEYNSRIQVFTKNGGYLSQWGSYGQDNGEFNRTGGVSVAPDGSVYVVDPSNNRVQKFSSNGTYQLKWGSYGAVGLAGNENGELNQPASVATDSKGNVYVADSNNDRIQKFSSNGKYLDQWGEPSEEVPAKRMALQSENVYFDNPRGVAVGPDDSIYVADTYNDRMVKLNSDGELVTEWGTSSGGGQMDRKAAKFSLLEEEVTFDYPVAVAVDSHGDVYVSDSSNNRIQKFTKDGDYILEWGSEGEGNGEFFYPGGITIDNKDNVYVADSENGRIQKFTKNGTYITQWGEFEDTNIPFFSLQSTDEPANGATFTLPVGVASDRHGNVYVSDLYSGTIKKFTDSGKFLTQWGGQGEGNGEFAYPDGLTVDSFGNVYVADSDNHRIQKFGYAKKATLQQPAGSKKIVFESPAATSISESHVVSEGSLAKQDDGLAYPLGLVDFKLLVPTGSTQKLTLTFVTDLKPQDVVARKYHESSKTYTNVPGAKVTETTVDGKSALKLTYSIKDGGTLDDDKKVNGVIVDPIGLAVTAAPGAPDSGVGRDASSTLTLLFVAILIAPATLVAGRGLLKQHSRR